MTRHADHARFHPLVTGLAAARRVREQMRPATSSERSATLDRLARTRVDRAIADQAAGEARIAAALVPPDAPKGVVLDLLTPDELAPPAAAASPAAVSDAELEDTVAEAWRTRFGELGAFRARQILGGKP